MTNMMKPDRLASGRASAFSHSGQELDAVNSLHDDQSDSPRVVEFSVSKNPQARFVAVKCGLSIEVAGVIAGDTVMAPFQKLPPKYANADQKYVGPGRAYFLFRREATGSMSSIATGVPS
jgi:hypothetical protein